MTNINENKKLTCPYCGSDNIHFWADSLASFSIEITPAGKIIAVAPSYSIYDKDRGIYCYNCDSETSSSFCNEENDKLDKIFKQITIE